MLTLLVSCGKEKKTNKLLAGSWTPVTLRVTNQVTGLSHSAASVGSLNFQEESKGSTNGTYTFAIDYKYKGDDYQINESGTYQIEGEECFLTSSVNNETPTRIIFINKVDLEFGVEKPNTNRLVFVLKKN